MTTPQAVSAVLRRAGHERSTKSATAVRGWNNYSRGFRARRCYPEGCVQVDYEDGDVRYSDQGQERAVEAIGLYTKTLRTAGLEVTAEPERRQLTVTGKTTNGGA